MNSMEEQKLSIYLGALSLINFPPFSGEPHIFFVNETPSLAPAQWNVIIGNNNTGKTRLLKIIANTFLVNSKTVKTIGNAYQAWLFEKLTQNFHDLGINPKEVSEKVFEKEFKKIRQNEKAFSEVPTAVATTIYKDIVSENISLGQYQGVGAIDLDNEDEDSKLRVNIGEAKYTCTIPENSYPFIIAYGVNRRSSESNLASFQNDDSMASLLIDNSTLLNVEDWLIQTDYALKNEVEGASNTMDRIKKVLTSGILPDVNDFQFSFIKTPSGIQSYVEFSTPYGWTQLSNLGYGYQASITWLLDLCKRMIDRYTNAENPLNMPAIVLVDEIDLHLHPAWQRKIIGYLSDIFPNVQFIVTAHSPLIIQSAREVNLIMLQKEDNYVTVSQPNVASYKGWSVEEIMSELMGLENATFSDTYLKLMAEFDKALDEENFEEANAAYQKLDEILPLESGQRKVLRIQMASLSPAH